MSGQQNVSKVSWNVKTQGGDYSNTIWSVADVGESISLLNEGLRKMNVIIVVREAVAQRNVERNGETLTPINQAKINEQLKQGNQAKQRLMRVKIKK